MTEALWWDFNIEIFLNVNSLRYFNGKQLYSQISLLPWAAVCDELRRRLAGRSRQAAGDCNYAGVVSPCNRSWSRTAGVWYPTAYHISKDIFLGHTQIGVEFFWRMKGEGRACVCCECRVQFPPQAQRGFMTCWTEFSWEAKGLPASPFGWSLVETSVWYDMLTSVWI